MLENTLENKAKFAAPYIGCNVIIISEPKESFYPFDKNESGLKLTGILNGSLIIRRIAEDVKDRFNQCELDLTPLSQITDEHLLEIGKIYFKQMNISPQNDIINIQTAKNLLSDFKCGTVLGSVNINVVVAVINFLRSKSYYIGDGTEINYGWAILKTEG